MEKYKSYSVNLTNREWECLLCVMDNCITNINDSYNKDAYSDYHTITNYDLWNEDERKLFFQTKQENTDSSYNYAKHYDIIKLKVDKKVRADVSAANRSRKLKEEIKELKKENEELKEYPNVTNVKGTISKCIEVQRLKKENEELKKEKEWMNKSGFYSNQDIHKLQEIIKELQEENKELNDKYEEKLDSKV